VFNNLKIIVAGIIMVLFCAGIISARWSEELAAVSENDDFIDMQVTEEQGQGYVPGEVLVRFKESASMAAANYVHSRIDSVLVEEVPGGIERVKIKDGLTVEEAVEEYLKNPEVEYAQPNYIKHIYTVPNDTSFNELWGLHNTGQAVNGTAGTVDADIDAPEAWDIDTGSSTTIVAVLDTGADYTHPDLSANIWSNTGETSCSDGVDNDANGYTDDCNGWDFWADDNDPSDFHSHGTHVAGIIGAVGNNSTGVAGVNWTTKIMALRVGGVSGAISTSAELSAISYAVANGAKIINASFGATVFDQLEYDAIKTAGEAGVLFVAAAGNGGIDSIGDNNDLLPPYPASYDLSNIISVAATDQNDNLAGFSNYGPVSVDVAAPGTNTYSTMPGFGYGSPVTVYSTDFDSDTPGSLPSDWNSSGSNNSWAVKNDLAFSNPNSLEDSPTVDYSDNTDSKAWHATPLTPVRDNRYILNFKINGKLESGFDFLNIIASADQSNWSTIGSRTGDTGGFFSDNVSLSAAAAEELFISSNFNSFYIGFGLITDGNTTNDGVYIDDVVLTREPVFINSHIYGYKQGTSMAAPYVSGLAALIRNRNPNLTALEVKNLILNNVDARSSLTGKILTGGRINAFNTLNADPGPDQNNPPSIAELVHPESGQTGLPTTLSFKWKPSTDPDEGDTVSYSLYYCEDQGFTGCDPVVVASVKNTSTRYAGMGYGAGLLLFGMAVACSIKGRKKILVLMLIVTGTLFVSCGGGGSGGGNGNTNITHPVQGLNPNTTYYWKVVASDGQDTSESETRSFTTGS